MNDSMHIVEKVWYRLYLGMILLFCVAVAAGSAIAPRVPSLGNLAVDFGFGTTTLVLAGITIAYGVSLYWFVYKYNPTLAMFGASLLFALLLLDGLTMSNQASGYWLYVGGWLLSTLFVGMYGMPMLLGTLLLAVVYMLMSNDFVVTEISTQQGILLSATGLLVIVSHLFWRNRFADPVNRQLSQLTGMLRTKEEQAAILIQSIADGVIVTNTEGKITLMNRSAANMTGWTVEEAAGINVEQVFKVAKEKGEEISKEEYPFTAVLAHKAFFNQVLQLTARNGKKQIISLVISPVVTPTGEVFGAVAVLRDISDQR
ncbi:MAG TPA: PAS domain-containing protein, partial [Nitrososphaera sp.]|nr:PAS domain-containing protein [Nitrososphaera sp.]